MILTGMSPTMIIDLMIIRLNMVMADLFTADLFTSACVPPNLKREKGAEKAVKNGSQAKFLDSRCWVDVAEISAVYGPRGLGFCMNP